MANCSSCHCGVLKLLSNNNKISNGTTGKRLKVMLFGSGSRGDCQPMVALCLALEGIGFDCILMSNPESEQIATGAGIKFESNGNPFVEFFTCEDCKKAFTNDDYMSFLMGLGAHTNTYQKVVYERIYNAIQKHKPDLCLTSVLHWQDKFILPILFRIPTFHVNLSNVLMVDPDKAPFNMPSAPPGENKPIWEAVYKGYLDGLADGISVLEKLAGKPKKDWFPTPDEYFEVIGQWPGYEDITSSLPEIFMLEKDQATPRDRPWFVFTGAPIMPAEKCGGQLYGATMQNDLENFLAASPEPPIYFGWGSVSCGSAQSMVARAVRALMILNRRGIILGGYSKLSEEGLAGLPDEAELKAFCKKNVLFMQTANHSALFPRCGAIVHHGGVGTTNASVRAGVPSIITPIFYDQFQSKAVVENIGCGVGTDQLGKLTPENLADEIKRCLGDKEMLKAAKMHREKCLKENGAAKTASLIAEIWEDRVKTGKYWEVWDKIIARKQANLAKAETDAKISEDK